MRLARDEGSFADAAFDTVYLGGGTPSLAPPEELGRLLAGARTLLGARPDAWITLEANPEQVTTAACAAWRDLGIAAVSLGVQSFDEADLAFLGRGHSPEQGADAARTALAAGFPWVSLDLIYGLPGQSEEAWQRNLETAAALAPHHLSCYQLTIHDGTPFGFRAARGELAEMPEPAQARLFSLTRKSLSRLGFPAYEVSNFARAPELRSRHNRKYWDHTPYLGLGPSAHSFALVPASAHAGRADAGGASARGHRWCNERHLRVWEQYVVAGNRPVAGEELLGPPALASETLLLGLRTTAGVDLDAFAERYGIDLLETNHALVTRLVRAGRLQVREDPQGQRLAPTVRGLAVADSLAAAFDLPLPT